jgi:hypothetical protein
MLYRTCYTLGAAKADRAATLHIQVEFSDLVLEHLCHQSLVLFKRATHLALSGCMAEGGVQKLKSKKRLNKTTERAYIHRHTNKHMNKHNTNKQAGKPGKPVNAKSLLAHEE